MRKPNFFIPGLTGSPSEDVPKTVSTDTQLLPSPIALDGEDILSDMYAEKAAVIAMLSNLRNEVIESKSTVAVRALDVLIADVKRRDVGGVWQLGTFCIATGTK